MSSAQVTPTQRVLVLIAVIVGLDAGLLAATLDATPPVADAGIGFLVLTAAFALVEWRVIHVQFRAEASSFSLFEVPLVLGLLYDTPRTLLAASVVGVGVGLLAGRRQPPLKIAFNVANLSLYTGVASLTLQLAPSGASDRWIWLTIIVGVIVGSASSFGLIIAAVTLTEGFPGARQALQSLSFGLVVSLANTAIGLTAAIILAEDVFGLVLLSVPGFLMFSALRTIAAEREQRERVEFLYRSTHRLDVGGSEAGLATLLDEARSMFKAEIGAVILKTTDDEYRLVHSGPDGQSTDVWTSERDLLLVSTAKAQTDEPILVRASDGGDVAVLVRKLGGRDAMVAKLTAEDRDLGLLVIANRLGNVTSFTVDDLQVLGALARQSGVLLHSDRLELALTELRQLERELSYQASHDSLTGLSNRARFSEALQLVAGSGQPFALLFIDLDGFKAVNDTHGHAAGDAVLVEVADRLTAAVRPLDSVARFGGDEFAVLLVDTETPEVVADRIMADLAQPIALTDGSVTIGCSIGLTRGGEGSTADDLLRDADSAMYRAKQSGKGSVHHHREERIEAEEAVAPFTAEAIDDGQLELHYQPIVDVAGRRVVGLEALVRWRNPQRGLLPAGEFLPAAERLGLILDVDRWVLDRVAGDLVGESIGPDLFVAVNLSAAHLEGPALVEALGAEAWRPLHPQLVVEWPEPVLMHELDQTGTTLSTIRQLGVRVAMSGFGDGYASLSYLRRLGIDMVKLSRSMTASLSTEATQPRFLRGIVESANALGLDVVAEGIERDDQLAALPAIGCGMAQGFLFARPMTIDALRPLLELSSASARPHTGSTTPLRFS